MSECLGLGDILDALPEQVRAHGALNVDWSEDESVLLISFLDRHWMAFEALGEEGWKQLSSRPQMPVQHVDFPGGACACGHCCTPAERDRLTGLGTIECSEVHAANVFGERLEEPHTIAECGGSPMEEKLGATLPQLPDSSSYGKCKRLGHHVMGADKVHCRTCGLMRGLGAKQLWPEPEEPEAGPLAMTLVSCDCGAQFTKPVGVERACTRPGCGSVHA